MPIKAVFFDIDGTLVDSNDFHVMAWDEAFHESGLQAEQAVIRGQIGKGADQLIPSLFPDVEPERQKMATERHGQLFRTRYLHQVKPFPCADDLVKLLHAEGKDVILASSAEKAEADYYVEMLKLSSLLKGVVTKDDVEKSKPAGDIFAAALAEVFPIAASETLAIGDTPYDVQSALRSDVKTIAVRSGGFSGQVLADAGAPYVYASVKELFDNFDTSPLRD
jgi:membrane protein